jgi:hypothetical protein
MPADVERRSSGRWSRHRTETPDPELTATAIRGLMPVAHPGQPRFVNPNRQALDVRRKACPMDSIHCRS